MEQRMQIRLGNLRSDDWRPDLGEFWGQYTESSAFGSYVYCPRNSPGNSPGTPVSYTVPGTPRLRNSRNSSGRHAGAHLGCRGETNAASGAGNTLRTPVYQAAPGPRGASMPTRACRRVTACHTLRLRGHRFSGRRR